MHSAIPFALLEAVLRRQRLFLSLVIFLLVFVSWFWIAVMAADMQGPMEGASAWMMTPRWNATYLVLLWLMWAVMMTAMMLPSAAPALLLYLRAARNHQEPSAALRVYALAAGYLSVWALFSVGATLLQGALLVSGLLSPMMKPQSVTASAVLLLIAGIYQLTPLKNVCLRSCRSPLSFLMQQWKPGSAGAYRMGAEHGAYCLGCCWALMLLLFAGGVMNLAVVVALTAWVSLEKLAPFGEYVARLGGILLAGTAVWMLAA